jgi:hypothetical protein
MKESRDEAPFCPFPNGLAPDVNYPQKFKYAVKDIKPPVHNIPYEGDEYDKEWS